MERCLWTEVLMAIAYYADGEADQDFVCDDDEAILCRTEAQAEALADLLDQCGYVATTGYYDPVEDSRDGCEDWRTGKYYVKVD